MKAQYKFHHASGIHSFARWIGNMPAIAWPMLLGLLSSAAVLADEVVIKDVVAKEPVWYCRPTTTVARYLSTPSLVSMDHLLVIAEDHQGREGDVFVGLQRASEPGKLWLFGDASGRSEGLSWVAYDGVQPPLALYQINGLIKLPALLQISVIVSDLQFQNFKSDATVLVGYGMRKSADATAADSFGEMVAAQRFLPIWGPVPLPGLSGGDGTYADDICLIAGNMRTWTASRSPSPGASISSAK